MFKQLKPAMWIFALGAATLMPASPRFNPNQAPDNTAVNKQDRDRGSPDADHAGNKMSDVQLQKSIRRDVVKDKSLSSYGHNVKVVASKGRVTLRGPVHSDEEKQAIEQHARQYAGEGNVDNQITVKGDRN